MSQSAETCLVFVYLISESRIANERARNINQRTGGRETEIAELVTSDFQKIDDQLSNLLELENLDDNHIDDLLRQIPGAVPNLAVGRSSMIKRSLLKIAYGIANDEDFTRIEDLMLEEMDILQARSLLWLNRINRIA